MIDVSKIKVGDRVMIRKGKWYTVQDVAPMDSPDYPVSITFKHGDGNIHLSYYTEDGFYWTDKQENGHDIVAVKPTQPAQDEMAIRDKFASDYIQQLNVWPEGYAMGHHAKRAYEYADAMMKARKEIKNA